jgi:hypothetical protein
MDADMRHGHGHGQKNRHECRQGHGHGHRRGHGQGLVTQTETQTWERTGTPSYDAYVTKPALKSIPVANFVAVSLHNRTTPQLNNVGTRTVQPRTV